jgi:hypothetical protein
MTKQEVFNILVLIESVYTGYITKNETFTYWFQYSSEFEYEKVLSKLQMHIRKSPYPPTIADLTEVLHATQHDDPFHWMSEYRAI